MIAILLAVSLQVCTVDIPKAARIAYVHNNPGQIVWVKGVDRKWRGEPKKGGGWWRKFPSRRAGYRGILRQIKLDTDRGLTLGQFIAKYAPSFENQTSKYIRYAMRVLKVSASAPLEKIPPHALARAMAWRESNTKVTGCR